MPSLITSLTDYSSSLSASSPTLTASAPSLSDNDRKLDIIIQNQNEVIKTLARMMEKMDAKRTERGDKSDDMNAMRAEDTPGKRISGQKDVVAPTPVVDDKADDNADDKPDDDAGDDKNASNNNDQDGGKRSNKQKGGKRHNKTVVRRMRKPSRLQSQRRRA
jgi:hypothetical protein